MRAIIIQDADAKALLDRLELRRLKGDNILLNRPPEGTAMVDWVHRSFHYEVCRWLQEQGADVTR
jgi:hypothetical protein